MSNTKRAVKGDIVRYVGPSLTTLKPGEIFEITGDGYSEWMAGYYAGFTDAAGQPRAFWKLDRYEIIGKVSQKASTLDIQGNEIKAGDTIAYAFGGSAFRHLALFEVQSISGRTALCRAKADGAVVTLGVFEERAIIIK